MMRSLDIVLLLGFLALVGQSVAEEYIVGDRAGWRPRSVDYAQWSARKAFRAGDSLLFPYDQRDQSVMRVSKEDFHLCRTHNPIEHYTDGNTIVRLDGDSYYFISGVPDHCNAGMRLEVVLAGASPSGAPSSAPKVAPPSLSSPVPTPSAAPSTPPSTAPLSSPTVAPSAPPLAAPTSSPTVSPTMPPSESPTGSSPPASMSPAEGPGMPPPPNAASALPSALATVLIGVIIATFTTV